MSVEDKYKDKTDEELVALFRSGELEVAEYLCVKYKGLVNKNIYSNNMFLQGAELEDLHQEGMIGLVKAILGYDPDKKASFYTFANSCIHNQLCSAVTASTRQKHIPLNSSLSINEEENTIVNTTYVPDDTDGDMSTNPEKILIDREFTHAL